MDKLARGLQIPLLLLTAIDSTYPDALGGPGSLRFDVLQKDLSGRLRKLVEQLAHHEIRAEYEIVSGRPADEIVGIARRRGCDLIAMFHHARPAAARGVLGSVTDKVVHSSPVPVLTMAPERAGLYEGHRAWTRAYRRIADPRMTSIMLTLDGSRLAEAAIPYVEDLAGRLSLRVLLVRAVKPTRSAPLHADSSNGNQQVSPEEKEAATYLDAVASRLRGIGLVVRSTVLSGDKVVAIADMARQSGPDLIAVATHQRPRWGLGSVAEGLIRRAEAPVLVVSRPTPGVRAARGQAGP